MRRLRPRFTISGAMGVVLVFALGMAALRNADGFWADAVSLWQAALRNADGLWAGVVSLLTWGLLGAAVLGVILGRGKVRARWLGAFVFGGGYFVLVFGPGFDGVVGPTLATTHLLGYGNAQVTYLGMPPFLRIGHCLFTILAGACGAVVADSLVSDRESPPGPEQETPV